MSQDEKQETIQVHMPQDLEYCYRDIANIFVGSGEVTLEFGNHHKSTPGNASINNRIVMSLHNAYDLQQRLEQALMEAQEAMTREMTT
jgi:site-specific DNA-adenine methylase